MNRIDQLISGYLDGRLDPADAKELANLLEQDGDLRSEFIELFRQHQLLSEQRTTVSESNFVERVLADLRMEAGNSLTGLPNDSQRQEMEAEKRPYQAKNSSRIRTFLKKGFRFQFPWPALVKWGAMAMAVALVTAVGSFFVFRNGLLSAVITKTSDGVTVVRNHQTLNCHEGLQLRAGDMLQTPAGGTAMVQYLGEKTTLALKAGTQLRFQNSKHGKRLNLEAGEISVVAGHQPANAPMVLMTPYAEARVVGTRFQIASRRSSTWLQVSEGGVAFQRNSTRSNTQEGGGSESDPKSVLVSAGEYSVAADGIPLKVYPVTDLLNLAHPLPIKIGWFSYYGQPYWYVHPPSVQEVQPTNTSRTFQLPAIKGSLLISGMVTVDSIKRDLQIADGNAGFAVGLSTASDYLLACVERKNDRPVLEILGFNMVPLAEVPIAISSWPACKIKLAVERAGAQSQDIVVRAKAWSDAGEPETWQLSTNVKLHEASGVFELRLVTVNSACTFENVSAFLTE